MIEAVATVMMMMIMVAKTAKHEVDKKGCETVGIVEVRKVAKSQVLMAVASDVEIVCVLQI